jgi:hypothetical protein
MHYLSLVDLIERQEIARKWEQIALELGFAPPPNLHEPSLFYRRGRCYCTVQTAGVWYLSEFNLICEDTPLKRDFFLSLNRLSKLAGHQIVAAGEDLLTLLVVYARRSFFNEWRRRDLGFKDQILDALTDMLPIQSLKAGDSEQRLQRPFTEGEKGD